MTFSLYDATIPAYLQILPQVSRLIDGAEAFVREKGMTPSEIIDVRLFEDMHPFAYQVKSTAVHSVGAIEGLRQGVFRPDNSVPPASFDALRQRIAETIALLEALSPAEVNGFAGKPMRFEFGPNHIDFTGENFLLSFSQPNFYFHATTSYNILRMLGVPLGKRDFLGRVRKEG